LALKADQDAVKAIRDDLKSPRLGPAKCSKIRLTVMDMWLAFRNSTLKPESMRAAFVGFGL
jgi:hypothetical protein